MADMGITYDVIRELVALDDDSYLPPNIVFLGQQFHLPRDKAAFSRLVRSRIWCTYRRGFKAISGTSMVSDQGWGCTLRCGQMMLAEALLRKHLQPEWCWDKKERSDPRYRTVLSKFLDLKDSSFSIQRIAVQGIDLGRRVGEWFGPNTIAHVLRKLTDLDSWSQVAVHVAADMTVITDEMRQYFTRPFVYHMGKVCVEEEEDNPRIKGSKSGPHPPSCTSDFNERDLLSGYSVMSMSNSSLLNSDTSSEELSHTTHNTSPIPHNMFQSYADIGTSILRPGPREEDAPPSLPSEEGDGVTRSVLMMIPLRLGNEKFNPSYWEGLKRCFELPQCVGIIGGRPRHALWFVGYRGDYLLYFDPHTTQPTVSAEDPLKTPDESYHIDRPDHMDHHELDPSLALGFFFKDLTDFDKFCDRVRKTVIPLKPPLFEIIQSRPHYWAKTSDVKVTEIEPFLLVNADVPGMEDEEGFVLVEGPEGSQ